MTLSRYLLLKWRRIALLLVCVIFLPSVYLTWKSYKYEQSRLHTEKLMLEHEEKMEKLYGAGNRTKTMLNKLPPLSFLPDYKNPCFRDGPSQPLLCLPAFQLAGFIKCGTSDLNARIKLHPDVALRKFKESDWMEKGELRDYNKLFLLHRYIHQFQEVSGNIEKNKIRTKNGSIIHPAITGDAEPTTLYDNRQWHDVAINLAGVDGPVYTMADFVHEMTPQAKIIVMLRNPVTRMESEYLYFNKDVRPNDFHERVVKMIADFEKCTATHTVRRCAYGTIKPVNTNRTDIRIGIYYIFLGDWLKVFPRKQIFLIRTEDYAITRDATVKQVYDFLDLRPLSKGQERTLEQKTNHNVSPQHKQFKLRNDTLQLLQKFYQPFNVKLAQLLSDSRFLWNSKT